MTDRRTAIDGDQITDHTITPEEIAQVNSPSNGQSLVFENTDNFRWITKQNQIQIVTTYEGLPSSPTLNDFIFYTQFNCFLKWDGSHWVAPKISKTLFGKNGFGIFSTWLNSIGDVEVSPRFISGSVIISGLYLPEFSTPDSVMWKLYNITAKSDRDITGDLEIHENCTTLIPVYATTGKAKVTFSGSKYADTQLGNSVLLNPHSRLQCYFRLTSGTWDNLSVTLTLAKVAIGTT